MTKDQFKQGDKVQHKWRDNKYQKCTVLRVEDGCNGGIVVCCLDGFYGHPDISTFCPVDLIKINSNE